MQERKLPAGKSGAFFRPRPTKNVKFRAVDFRGNFVYLVGSNVNIVTGEMGKIHRKGTGKQ